MVCGVFGSRITISGWKIWKPASKERCFDGTQGLLSAQCRQDRYVRRSMSEEPAQGVPQAYWSPDGQWVVAMCYEPGLFAPGGIHPKDLQPKGINIPI